jgi:peptide/nickel transport system ATP-binding protein
VEEAPARERFKNPKHPYTQGLLGSVPVIGKKAKMGRRLQEIPGMVPGPLETPAGCRFHPRCPEVMDVCRREAPEEMILGEHRRVRCWLTT